MAKITYDNKTYLNQNVSVPNVNKVCDSDMNEIKSVVNSNYDEMKDTLFYKANDLVEMGELSGNKIYLAPGTITGSGTTVLFTLQVGKRLDNVSTVSVNNVQVVMRGINGNLNSTSSYTEYVGASGYTVAADISSPTSITIRITKSSAFTNITNNTPVIILGYFRFTLS